MAEATCSIPGCERPRYQRREMCGSHFMKAYRYGDPHYRAPIRFEDLTGQRFGALTALTRIGRQWRCGCDCGTEIDVLVGDLHRGATTTCGDKKTHRRAAATGYGGMHSRLRVDRGDASAHRCFDCGRRAQQWSYDHSDPDQLVENGMPYSMDPLRYVARCVPCHKRFDLALLRD